MLGTLLPIIGISIGAFLAGLELAGLIIMPVKINRLVFFGFGVAMTMYYGIHVYNELSGCV